MNRLSRSSFAPHTLKGHLLIAIGIAASWLIVSSLGAAQEATATLSGRVFDVDRTDRLREGG